LTRLRRGGHRPEGLAFALEFRQGLPETPIPPDLPGKLVTSISRP
jgi:hypothetical protein